LVRSVLKLLAQDAHVFVMAQPNDVRPDFDRQRLFLQWRAGHAAELFGRRGHRRDCFRFKHLDRAGVQRDAIIQRDTVDRQTPFARRILAMTGGTPSSVPGKGTAARTW
jgi:hypothetical protein